MVGRALQLARELRQMINKTGAFRVLELADLLPAELANDGVFLDPTKITVDIRKSGFSAAELAEELAERFNIVPEKSTCVVLVVVPQHLLLRL